MCARRVLRAGLGVDTLKGPARKKRLERDLLAHPMPERVEPCLAQLQSKPPVGDDWAFEVKWDGYRLAVHIERGRVRIITRGGHDWTARFPTIAHDARELGLDSAILDGEAVVLDERGASDFGALQRALGGRGGKRFAAEARLYAFDLLYLNGHDLRSLPQDDRRDMLADAISSQPHGSIGMSEDIDASGAQFLKRACELGLEGIIAKRRSAPYRSGRSGDWLKIKCVQTESFAIIGYEPSAIALGGIGRLLVAARKGDGLVYVGGVGTGFTRASGSALRKQMDKLVVAKAPISMPVQKKGYRWIRPDLIAEIALRGWTEDDKLRHASFKGLREAADEASVFDLSQRDSG